MIRLHPVSYKCPMCSKEYRSEYWYHRHVVSVHENKLRDDAMDSLTTGDLKIFKTLLGRPPEPRAKYPCSFCDQIFFEESSRNQHLDHVHLNFMNLFPQFCG